jgi:diguanylate cyclase (GGDEF)-like protein
MVTASFESRIRLKGGEVRTFRIDAAPAPLGAGLFLLTFHDITPLMKTQVQLRKVAVTDPLTGALNRQGMERVLNAELDRAERYRGKLSLILLDIDGFGKLNEVAGHAVADRVLCDLALAVKSHLRVNDIMGRWSGDEIMILVPGAADGALQLCEQLRDLIRHSFTNLPISVTVSAGLAEFKPGLNSQSIVKMAGDALEKAKKAGGTRAALADPFPPETK